MNIALLTAFFWALVVRAILPGHRARAAMLGIAVLCASMMQVSW